MKKLGPYYGPFKPKEYVHLLCVIWCSKVFVDEKTGKLRNVIKAIEQARDSFCSYCGRDGAGLGCHK